MDKYEKLKDLKKLLDNNLITQDEFQALKREVLDGTEEGVVENNKNNDRATNKLFRNIIVILLLLVGSYYGFNFVKKKNLDNILKSDTNLINDSTIIQKNDISVEQNDDNFNSLKKFNDVQLTLIDASLKKAKLYLGEPDKIGLLYMGGSEKNAAIYLNKVNDNGVTKHLVLFLRYYTVEEIYAIRDNEKAYFGIHYVEVRNNNFYSNSVFFDKY